MVRLLSARNVPLASSPSLNFQMTPFPTLITLTSLLQRGTPLARTPASASTFHATEDEGDSAPTAADAAEPFDFAMWRDRWLVGDCVNMLTQLLLGIAMRIEEAELDVGAVKGLSAEFCAIRAACRRNPPTLLQLSSHKYFAPLGEAQQVCLV